jgi:hypothetical protein
MCLLYFPPDSRGIIILLFFSARAEQHHIVIECDRLEICKQWFCSQFITVQIPNVRRM